MKYSVNMNLPAMKREAVPLHAEVAALLRNQIMSGTLVSGEQLPPLSELTRKLGVARMTIRQAMDALESEGLIERHSGRGTYVKRVKLPKRQTLNLQAELSQLYSMVSQLEVSVLVEDSQDEQPDGNGIAYHRMKRIHTLDGKPFCHVDLRVDSSLYEKAPERFASEIVISVLEDLGVQFESARQWVTISYADFELSQALNIKVNSPVFRVYREIFDSDERLIYSSTLLYPGDALEFEMEFKVDTAG